MCDFWGHVKFLFFIQFWWDFFFIRFFTIRTFRIVQPIISIFKIQWAQKGKTRFSVECKLKVKHITLVKHIIVSNTLLCQTHYWVEQVLEAYLFLCTFCFHVPVLSCSCCDCEASQFHIAILSRRWYQYTFRTIHKIYMITWTVFYMNIKSHPSFVSSVCLFRISLLFCQFIIYRKACFFFRNFINEWSISNLHTK